jgi:hypothetical protein
MIALTGVPAYGRQLKNPGGQKKSPPVGRDYLVQCGPYFVFFS